MLAAAAAVGAGALWVLLRRRRPAAAAPGVTIVPKYGSLATNGDPDEFSVLTFNILADVFAQRDAAACSESGVIYSWQHRWPLIEKTIAAAGADVVLLQEVDVARWGLCREEGHRGGRGTGTREEGRARRAPCLLTRTHTAR